MADFTTADRMVILYDNVVDPDLTTVTVTNFSVATNKDHLAYQDPGRVFKATPTTAAPTIKLEWSVATPYPTVSAVGFIRHNLALHGGVAANYDRVVGGATGMGQYIPTWNGPDGYGWDVGLVTDGGAELVNYVQFVWAGADTGEQMMIGSIFVGQHYEVATNPKNNSLVYNVDMPYIVEESEGGTKHIVTRSGFDNHKLDWTVQMAKEVDVEFMHELRQTSRGDIIGVIMPHEVDAVGTSTMDHFFGYLDSIVTRPRSSTLSDRRYDMQISMIGV